MTSLKVDFIVTKSGAATMWFRDSSGRREYTVAADHPQHRKILEKLKVKDYTGLEALVSDKAAVALANECLAKHSSTKVNSAEIVNGVVCVNGTPVHNVVADRVLQLARGGYPVTPALRFLENLLENPSSRAVDELYDFLANRNLPLTEDGHFLAYKRIREDWLDIFSGKIDNSVGRIVEVARNSVDDDRAHECSYGLHVGALEYVRLYGNTPGTRVVIVKVNPRDCVSVPRDHNHQKLRVCRYEVLYELMEGDKKPLENPMYSTDGQRFNAVDDWVLEECDEECDYIEDGWSDDYDTWSKDALAYECVQRGLTSSRQEGRDVGTDGMKDLLRKNDLNQLEEEEECDYFDAEDIIYPAIGDKYVLVGDDADDPGHDAHLLGTMVKVTRARDGFVWYAPGLYNPEGFMSVDDFDTRFLRVKN